MWVNELENHPMMNPQTLLKKYFNSDEFNYFCEKCKINQQLLNFLLDNFPKMN
jgi:hypothetical protein